MNGEDNGRESYSESLFDRGDRERIRNSLAFVLGSVRRHRLFVSAVFVAIMGGAVASLFLLPKTYHVEAKALAQRNSALAVRGDGPEAESLTRVAAETVLRRDNLLALVKQTDLLRYTREHRAPAQRAKDALFLVLRIREDSEADQLDALIERLEKKLVVWTNETGTTVTIAIDWSDGPMACRLVDAAQRAFLDARYAREVTALAESIGILQGHTANLKADVDLAVSGIEAMRKGRDTPVASPVAASAASASSRPRPTSVSPAVTRVAGPDSELPRLKADMDARQRAIDELEQLRRTRQAELESHLAEARTTFTENHPAIGDLKQSIAALSAESPQVTSLRQEASSLKAEYDRRSASDSQASGPLAGAMISASARLAAGAGAATPPELPSDVLRLDLDLQEDRDPGMVYARGQLRDAMDKYSTLRSEIQTAQIDLETAQAAFKYRYTVVTPAHLPKDPTKPDVPIVLFVALIAATFSSLVFAVIMDVSAGRLLERWQLERILSRPILGDVALPPWEDAK